MIIFSQKVTAFTATNIPDEILVNGILTTIVEWTNLTAYEIEDIKRDGNWYYKTARKILATEDRKRPSEDTGTWARYAPSNAYAMLDNRSSTATSSSATDIIVEFENTYRYNSIVFGSIKASSITIEIFDSVSTLVSTQTILIAELGQDIEANWYSYYYAPLADEDSRYDKFVRIPETGIKIRVTIAQSIYGGAECAYMIVGNQLYCGESLSDVPFNFNDNSIKEKDNFGITTLTQRYAQETVDVDVMIDTSYFIPLKRKMKKMYGIPLAIVVDERDDSPYENIVSLSYLDNFDEILSDGRGKSKCNFAFSELV